jgi:hypothetical protein
MVGLNDEALAFGIDWLAAWRRKQEILHCLNVLWQIHPRPKQYNFIGNVLDRALCHGPHSLNQQS